MARRRYELDTRVLTIFFFVAMPFVAFGSFLVISIARASLEDSLGASFEQRAHETKFLLERYVSDQIDHLKNLAQDPQVRAALANPLPPDKPDDFKKLEKAWVSGADPKITAPILASPLAGRLRAMAQIYPGLKLLQIVDANGRLVASSARGGRLNNDDTSWFKAIVQDGTQSPYVGDVQRPAGGPVLVLELSFPLYNEDAHFLGVVREMVDAAHLYSVLAPVHVGRTGSATLIRSTDGMILAASESEKMLAQTFAGFPQIQETLHPRELPQSLLALFRPRPVARATERQGYCVWKTAGSESPARLAGFAPVDRIPNVDWLVVVEQDAAEAAEPIVRVTEYLWIHFVGVFGSVILLALYLSFKLETPSFDEELHLHEQHLPAGTHVEDQG